MHAIFVSLSVIGLLYFLLARRRFDWFAAAFFSACVYFLPGFFGYTSYLSIAWWNEKPINAAAYGIMMLVEAAILSGAVISDLPATGGKEPVITGNDGGNGNVLAVLLSLALLGLGAMVLTTGSAIFNPDKLSMMEELNRWHILFYSATLLGCVLSFEREERRYLGIFSVLVLLDVFIGFRMTPALAGISIMTLWLSRKGKQRLLVESWRPLLLGGVGALFLFFYKQIQFAVKIGDLALLKDLLQNPVTYGAMFTQSEPFIAQSTLNEITAQNFNVGMGHLKGVLYQFILFSPELGLESQSFNDLFQPNLFPEVEYGMANNIWAEMWSSGGWPLLVLFIVFFVVMLKLFSLLTVQGKASQRAVVAVLASLWAFYIHRNDIIYEIALMKRVLLVALLAFVAAALIRKYVAIPRHAVNGPPTGSKQ